MEEELNQLSQYEGSSMQQINSIVGQLRAIMQDGGISQTHIINVLDGKVARNTVLSFFKDADCKLSTLLMILDACGVDLRLETELSRAAIMNDDISAYRQKADEASNKLKEEQDKCSYIQQRNKELTDKNASLTRTVSDQQTQIDKMQSQIDKMQSQIEKYMERMEKAENALYLSNADCRRKDAKIVELLNEKAK